MGMMGSLFLLPVFAQTFLGYSATESGYLFMPMAFMMVIASPLGGSLVGKVQSRYVIFASTIIASIGTFMFMGIDPKSTALDIIIPLMVMSFGLGLGMSQRTNIIASVVDQHEIGIASSVLALVRNIAGAFGIAIFGTILNNSIKSNVISINNFSHISTSNPQIIQQFIALVELKAQVNSYAHVFFVAGIVIFLGSFIALWLKVNERTDIKVHAE
jgi:DHA2 family multidrug resistance protein